MPNKKALKIVQINTVPNGSTGSIMMSIHKQLTKDGYDSYVVWGRGRKAENDHEIYMNDKLGVYFHVLYSRLTGKTGFASKRATKILIKRLEEIKPDIIHLHNLHGYYINIELLFDYIKKNKIKTIWTLHDCWSFTGHCVHFNTTKCECWKGKKCISLKSYPKCYINHSIWCYKKKKQLYGDYKKLTIITPSKWLSDVVRQSFFNSGIINVINNGINTEIFNKHKTTSIKNKYGIKNQIIILGVASPWTKEKGINTFIELSKILDENKYKIVLVGLTAKQIKQLPNQIIGIEKTKNKNEIIDIFKESDIFLNPTHDDNYPTVNIEAYVSGLYMVATKVGGNAEIIDKFSEAGSVVKEDDIEAMREAIEKKFVSRKKEKRDTAAVSEECMYKKYKEIYENA